MDGRWDFFLFLFFPQQSEELLAFRARSQVLVYVAILDSVLKTCSVNISANLFLSKYMLLLDMYPLS